MKLGVLLDPLANLNPIKDTSLAILSQASLRHWDCVYFTLADLFAREGEVFARVSPIVVAPNKLTWKEKKAQEKPLNEFDIILIRKDPPFNLPYLYATQLLSLVEQQGVIISNKPQILRDHNEKLSLLQHAEVCPPTLVSMDIECLRAFWLEHRSVVFKPLDAMGGSSVFHIDESGLNLGVVLETLTQGETVYIMAQCYIPELIERGDKRIILIHGEPVEYALARFPKKGESRANLAAGGHGQVVPITERDRYLCAALKPYLQKSGCHFVGLDVIGDYVTEINVTSPTCVREIEAETGVDIIGRYLDFLSEL